MKNLANIKKKLIKKQAKVQKKTKNKTKAQALEIIKLATTNKKVEEIGIFKDILFDFINKNKKDKIPILSSSILSTLLLRKSKQVTSIHEIIQQKKRPLCNLVLEN